MRGLAIVVIGRNEGERLRTCLASAVAPGRVVIYVDSGSTDGSIELARSMGADVITLDVATGFTAGKARNVGFDQIVRLCPHAEYVQFVDGDCELQQGWLERAVTELDARDELAVVCGRRRERFPGASIYNRLCDMEWDTPVGEANACGGDALVRVAAFRQVGGFNPSMIAGEEPELCVRLREAGWKIMRLDAEMTLHDAAIRWFQPWWKRTVRAGHAYAEGAALHGGGADRHNVRATLSILGWGLILPWTSVALAWPTRGLSLLLLGAYAVLWLRILLRRTRRGESGSDSALYATFCLISKFAQAVGVLRYVGNRWVLRRQSRLIEYKQMSDDGSAASSGAPQTT